VLPRKFLYFLYQNGEFYAFPKRHVLNIYFSKRAP